VRDDEPLQLADQPLVKPEREVAVDPVHLRRETQPVEPPGLVARRGLELHAVQRGPAPERERLAQQPAGGFDLARRGPFSRLRQQPLEADRVQPLWLEVQEIPGRPSHDRVASVARQRLTQLRDVHVQGLPGGLRRRLAPELVDQPVAGDDGAGVEQQHREQGPLLRRPER
jgi:hypothetical protein